MTPSGIQPRLQGLARRSRGTDPQEGSPGISLTIPANPRGLSFPNSLAEKGHLLASLFPRNSLFPRERDRIGWGAAVGKGELSLAPCTVTVGRSHSYSAEMSKHPGTVLSLIWGTIWANTWPGGSL